MHKIRIGAVSYLNTKPLVFGLQTDDPRYELSFDLPGRLADDLAQGHLDVALIPSIEALDNSNYTVVSDACIACRGPVWSVKFLSRTPIDQIRTVGLDEGSRTSVVMTRIMLQQYGVQPEFGILAVDDDWEQASFDAILLIGDRAMYVDQSTGRQHPLSQPGENGSAPAQNEFHVVMDLGQWWQQWTGLPFVFAMWTASDSLTPSQLGMVSEWLNISRDQGIANLPLIAEREATRYRMTEPRCLSYLRDNLHFTLGEAEKLALNKFFDYASRMSLAPKNRSIKFHDCQVVR